MRHYNQLSKFQKAETLFSKGKIKKARRLFFEVVIEISSSDTDSMADINLANSAQDYLDEIEHQTFSHKSKKSSFKKYVVIFIMLVLISVVAILIFK